MPVFGAIRSRNDLDPDDRRLDHPRFSEENFHLNLKLVEAVEGLAADKGCTPAQLALAWLLAQGDDVVPIPGTRSLQRLAENADAVSVELSSGDLQHLGAVLAALEVHGARYPAAAVSLLSGDTPEL